MFSLLSDNSDKTLLLLGKAINYEFMSKQSSHKKIQKKSLRIGVRDCILKLTPFLHLNGSPMLSFNTLVTQVIFYEKFQ